MEKNEWRNDMRIKTWLQKNTSSLAGKKIAVTGSTGGIGKELCAYLAQLGAELILLDRNIQRSEAHRDSLVRRYGSKVICISLDLEDIHAAHMVTKQLIDTEIDVFIHNAGAYSIPRHFCSSGYENVFQINFATPYYMIRKLLPTLVKRGGRAVVVGSVAHRYSSIDPEDVDFRTRKAASKVYGNAKRYLMFALHELFRRESGAKLAVVHPGITFTNITAHYPKLIFAIIKHPMKVIFMKPRRACLSILRGVFEKTEYGTWIGPWLFDVWGMPKKRKLRDCKEEERATIGKIAEEVYHRCETTVKERKS